MPEHAFAIKNNSKLGAENHVLLRRMRTQVSADAWKDILNNEPFLEMIVSRCPIDVHIGVKNHQLNAHRSPTKPKGFSSWLCRGGAKYFANGTYGLHVVPKKTFNKVRDTFIFLSGPVGGHAPSSARGIVFKLINHDDLKG